MVLQGFKGVKEVIVLEVFDVFECLFLRPGSTVQCIYCFPLVKALAKKLVKNLAKKLVKRGGVREMFPRHFVWKIVWLICNFGFFWGELQGGVLEVLKLFSKHCSHNLSDDFCPDFLNVVRFSTRLLTRFLTSMLGRETHKYSVQYYPALRKSPYAHMNIVVM